MKTLSALALVAWIAGGLAVEAVRHLDREVAKQKALAAAQVAAVQRELDRQKYVADKNLQQAERFAIMCLDPALKYAYLGNLVLKCRAELTKHSLIL